MILRLLFFYLLLNFVNSDDNKVSFENKNYYDILEVSRTATDEEIKKSYRNLAKKLHPDRAGNTQQAQDTYLKLTKAYEVLRNQKLREKYDRDGKLELEDNEENEQSSKMFGGLFYKDAEYIVSLRSGTIEHSVFRSGDYWLVNYYSSHCHHCIDFAETYRTLGGRYKNIIHIGAFNCLNDHYVCNKESVHSLPTIKFYPSENEYYGDFSLESLIQFIQENVGNYVFKLTKDNMDRFFNINQASIFTFSQNIMDDDDILKVNMLGTAMRSINVRVYITDCELLKLAICSEMKEKTEYFVLYVPSGKFHNESSFRWYHTMNAKSLIGSITDEKEPLKFMDSTWILQLEWNLTHEKVEQLILLTNKGDFKKHYVDYIQIKESIPQDIPLAFIDCDSSLFCKRVYLKDIPILIFVNNDGIQVHHGNLIPGEIVAFFKAARSSNVVSLHPLQPIWEAAVTQKLTNSIVYLYNSHCQPCIKKIWEFRRLSVLLPSEKPSLYSVDCSIFSSGCINIGVSYGFPYLKFFNGTVQEISNDFMTAEDMLEFIKDTNNVYLHSLTPDDILNKVYSRKKNEIWLLDFTHSQCMPCIELIPLLKKLAKKYRKVMFATVDCVKFEEACSNFHVSYYPTLRLFPAGFTKSDNYIQYNSWYDYNLLDQFMLENLPTSSYKITSHNYDILVRRDFYTNWVIDLYASWCGPCRSFMPIFEKLAEEMTSNSLKFGKVDCASDGAICHELGARYYPYIVIISPYDKSSAVQIDSSTWDIKYMSSEIRRLMVNVDSDL